MILCNKFGFVKVRQKGSHIALERDGTFVTVPVKEIRAGLLNRILRDCNIGGNDFIESWQYLIELVANPSAYAKKAGAGGGI